MNRNTDSNEKLQLIFLCFLVLGLITVFFITPSLRPASLLTLLNVLFLGPVVNFLAHKKVPKWASILSIYGILSLIFFFSFNHFIRGFADQWSSLIESLPTFGAAALQKLGLLEQKIREVLNIEIDLGIKNQLVLIGSNTREWALTNLPSLIGSFASAMLLAPIFSFFILKDGDLFREQFQKLIPARYSESTIHVLTKIGASLGSFLRAKLIEAFLVGLLCYIGLKIVGTPYPGVFAVIAGITNVIPYLGPILGVIPPTLVLGFSENMSMFWPMILVFIIANAIDMILIFPLFVGRLVNLSPLTLLAAVAVGQELYGVIGMLMAVPCASILKIIFQEIVAILYA